VLVQGSALALERLVWLMLRVAVRCLPAGAQITLTVDNQCVEVELPVAGPGTTLPPEPLSGIGELEREAVSWMARQVGARVETRPVGDGIAWRVCWGEG
jgi:hypothetical protein